MVTHTQAKGAVRDEWALHWRQGLVAFLVISTSFGALNAISSLFILPLQQEFGWSRGEIALAQNASLLAALASPFLGRAVDRFGTRSLMLIGMTLTGLVHVGLSIMTGTLPMYYVLFALGAVTGLTASGLTCSRIVSEYFVRSRGVSLAIARSGLSVAAAVLPGIMFAVIASFGWRVGYLVQAGLVLCIALPCVYLWVGKKTEPYAIEKPATDRHLLLGWRTLLSSRKLWFLYLGAALGYAPATALMSQLQPLLISKGLPTSYAASLLGLAGLSSLVGALGTGMLVDRIWAPAVAFIFTTGSVIGTVLLALNGTLEGPTAIAAILLVGLGLGAEVDLVAFMVARYFGVPSFSTVYGMTIFFVALCGAVGASGLGLAFDRFGNYDFALLMIAGSFLVSGFLYLLLGRYPDPTEVPG